MLHEGPDNEIIVFGPSPLRKFMGFCNVPRCYKRTLIHNGTARQRNSCFWSIAVTKVYGILKDAPPWPLHTRHEHGMLQTRCPTSARCAPHVHEIPWPRNTGDSSGTIFNGTSCDVCTPSLVRYLLSEPFFPTDMSHAHDAR